MKTAWIYSIFSALTLIAACSEIEQPSSLKELRNLRTSLDEKLAKEVSPGAWEEGVRYLSLSDEAVKEGNYEEADRLANLGLIQVKIALASVMRANAQARLTVLEEDFQKLELETEQTQSKLKEMETLIERRLLRKQLEDAVEKTHRLAAAEEEQREKSLSEKERKTLEKARREIGQEILSRALIWTQVLGLFVSKGILESNRASIIDGEKKLAHEALEDLDLVSLQEHVEQVGMKALRLINEAWEGKDEEREKARALIADELQKAGFEDAHEDFALSKVVVFPSERKMKSSTEYRKLKSACEDNSAIHILTVEKPKQALLLIIPVP